jgi:hypothetical protein
MLSNTILFIGLLALGSPLPSTADQAFTVLQQNCGNENCHGGSDAYRFDVGNPSTMVETGVVRPGRAADSEVIRRVEGGIMPLGGYKGQPGAKLPPEDIRILRDWIDAGAPIPAERSTNSRRPFVSESQILQAILNDLQSAHQDERPYLRYFALANLWNSPDKQTTEIDTARAALSKLANHLSWRRKIAKPTALGPEGLILRVDLREYAWTWETWRRLTANYPYGIATRELTAKIERIEDLTGVTIPYIRADWFIANASKPPLYHEILQLPATLEGLESLLSVNAEFDVDRNFARRFGVRDSGVSRNNRAMERHSTVFGAYWKSFDFAGNNPEQDIFRNPLDLHADGGEIIFSLPNGLQGYFIINKQGRRIDDAPANIVRDRTNTDDPVVHNGRSCIGCHVRGMNEFQDQIVTTFESRTEALFDLERARSLYPGQPDLETLLESDNRRFADALARAGVSVPAGASDEPVNRVGRRYESTVTAAQAAADLSIEDPKTLLAIIAGSAELQIQGFDQFLGSRGGMKRDAWEHGFAAIAGQLGISSKKPDASIVVSIEGAR